VDALLHEDVEQEFGDNVEYDADDDRGFTAVAIRGESDAHVYVVEDDGTCGC